MESQSKYFPDAFYRVAIKGLCVRDGKVLLMREAEDYAQEPNHWELPGGGLDFGEDIFTGFNRETVEEMGLGVSRMAKRPTYVWAYKFENKRHMDWYYSLTIAYRIEFDDLNFTPTRECQEIRFFSKEELLAQNFPGQLSKFPDIFNPEDFTEDF